jgi:hypothetical protein
MAEGEEVEILLYDEEPGPSSSGKAGASVPPDSGAKG